MKKFTIPITVVAAFSLAAFTLLLAACPLIDETTETEVYGGPGVYAGGYCINSADVRVAGYWKNGTWVGLTPLDATKRSQVESLFVSGDDVYAGGYSVNSSDVRVAGYWKNGTWVGLTDPDPAQDSEVDSVFVSGSDVYVAGSNWTGPPGYWLNGTWIDLPPFSQDGGCWVSSIVVSGTDVYAGGSFVDFMNSPAVHVPGYWKNGTWIGLTPLDATQESWVWPLFVSGCDVYAAGQNTDGSGLIVPGYWKNGTWNGLTPLDATKDSCIWTLFVSGGDRRALVDGHAGERKADRHPADQHAKEKDLAKETPPGFSARAARTSHCRRLAPAIPPSAYPRSRASTTSRSLAQRSRSRPMISSLSPFMNSALARAFRASGCPGCMSIAFRAAATASS